MAELEREPRAGGGDDRLERGVFGELSRDLLELSELAPDAIRPQLAQLYRVVTDAAEAGGLLTFFTLGALTDPELAAVEGRIADFAAKHCGTRESSWTVDAAPLHTTVCPGWPRLRNALTSNRFPYRFDASGENAFSTVFWTVPYLPTPPGMIAVERGGRVEISGAYPDVRFFAVQPFDVETNSLGSLIDQDLVPVSSEESDGQRRFRARLVFSEAPSRPKANTLYVGRRADGGYNPLVFVVYRTYGSASGRRVPSSGGVPLPAITVYDRWGNRTEFFGPCDPYAKEQPYTLGRTRFPHLPVADPRRSTSGRFHVGGSWQLPVDLLHNPDALEVSTPLDSRRGELLVVRAEKPRSGRGADAQLRAWSACAYGFWNGAASDCLSDGDVTVDERDSFTLVVSRRGAKPRTHSSHTWLEAPDSQDGSLVLRYMLARDSFVATLGEAIATGDDGTVVERFVPRLAFCSREEFERGGWPACEAAHLRAVAAAAVSDPSPLRRGRARPKAGGAG